MITIPDQQLSPHFRLYEFLESDLAARHDLNQDPPPGVLANLRVLAGELEVVRNLLACPLIITSGYRCIELNRLLDSKDTSAHLVGLAADFKAPDYGPPLDVIEQLQVSSVLDYDQLIYEFGAWTHFGLKVPPVLPRREVLTIDRFGTRAGLLSIRMVA